MWESRSHHDDGDMVVVQGVNKLYGTRQGTIEALRDINCSMRAGSFVSLVGPSGCGKSTLLKLIGGLIPPTSGQVYVSGRLIDGPRRDIGVMFQKPVLFPWRTVLENVLLPVEIFGWDRSEYAEKAIRVLDTVGLRGFHHNYPWELSGGMQQRVCLSRLLIYEPGILLMDEPFNAVDEFTRERLNLELLELWSSNRQTIIFVTHHVAEAVFLSDEIYVMTSGPGRIRGKVTVDLPRPRNIGMMRSSRFAETIFQVRELLGLAS